MGMAHGIGKRFLQRCGLIEIFSPRIPCWPDGRGGMQSGRLWGIADDPGQHCIFTASHAAAHLGQEPGGRFPACSPCTGAARTGGMAMRLIDQVYPWLSWPTVLTGVSTFVADELRAVSGRQVQVLLNATRTED